MNNNGSPMVPGMHTGECMPIVMPKLRAESVRTLQ